MLKFLRTKKVLLPHQFSYNWISTHKSGEIVLYPMYASNRRLEVRTDIMKN